MGQEELDIAFSIKPTFLEALTIRNAIPFAWKRALSKDFKGKDPAPYQMDIAGQTFDLVSSSPKAWYKSFVKEKQQEIKRKISWENDLSQPGMEADIDWEATYALPYSVSLETKLQSFHFRIAHRIITCNKYLNNVRMKDNGACTICNKRDTILHFFVECPPVHTFWAKLDDWCEEHVGIGLSFLTKRERILGMTNGNGNPRTFKIINWFLLTAKFYIHWQRLFHKGELSLIAYLAEARKKLIIERMACQWEGKPHKFRIWKRVLEIMNP